MGCCGVGVSVLNEGKNTFWLDAYTGQVYTPSVITNLDFITRHLWIANVTNVTNGQITRIVTTQPAAHSPAQQRAAPSSYKTFVKFDHSCDS